MLPKLARYQLRHTSIFFFMVVLTGLGLAAARSPRGSNTPPACYSLPFGHSPNALRFSHCLRHLDPKPTCLQGFAHTNCVTSRNVFCNKDIITVFCGKVKPFEKFFYNVGRSGLLLPFFGFILPYWLLPRLRRHQGCVRRPPSNHLASRSLHICDKFDRRSPRVFAWLLP